MHIYYMYNIESDKQHTYISSMRFDKEVWDSGIHLCYVYNIESGK